MDILKYQAGAILGPGVWTGVPAHVYHGGEICEAPSLSSSVIKALLEGSPLHAITEYKRTDRESERKMDLGSAAHKLVLGEGADIVVIDFDNYRTKLAQEARDDATAKDKIPLLTKDYARAQALAGGMREALECYMGIPLAECLREVVLIWQDPETGCWCRAMVDCALPDLSKLADLKTTEAAVSPIVCARRIYDGYQIQEAHYCNGADVLDPENAGRREMAFIFAETIPPFAVSPPILESEAGKEMGRQQVKRAAAIWDRCLKANKWPGYATDPYEAAPPAWALGAWQEREMGDNSLNPEFFNV